MNKHRSNTPPRLPLRFLRMLSGAALIEDIEGDLEELYVKDRRHHPHWRASMKYWSRVLSIAVSYALRRRKGIATHAPGAFPLFHPAMITFYLRNALRSIVKSPVYSFINVLGLTLGVCTCLSVYLIVRHEFSFDKFHPDRTRLYRLVTYAEGPAGKWYGSSVANPLPRALRESTSGFENIAIVSRYEPGVTIPMTITSETASVAEINQHVEKKFARKSVKAALVEPQYFDIFPRQWMAGSATDMSHPFKVVITESRAQTYFGTLSAAEVLGKVLVYDDSLPATVVGIVKDWKGNSDLTATDFLSYATADHSFLKDNVKPDDWMVYHNSFQSYVKLHEGSRVDSMEARFTRVLKQRTQPNPVVKIEVRLQPLADVHFDRRTDEMPAAERYLYWLSGLAIFILIIAAINFVNLSTALSTRRAKEIGVRKTIGASRSTITMQFLTETLLLTTFSVTLACGLVKPVLNAFSEFISPDVSLQLSSADTIAFLLSLIFITSVIAGLYPSLVLSSFLPITTLRRLVPAGGSRSWFLRKTLIVTQFSLSITFIAGAVVMQRQLNFIQTEDRGFRTDGVRMFWTSFSDFSNRPHLLLDRVRQVPGVADASIHGGSPMGFATFMTPGALTNNQNEKVDVILKSGDARYIPLYGIRIVAGRNIQESDSLREVAVNETFARTFGFQKPEDILGHSFHYLGGDYPIVGVVADFHQHSFHSPIGPVAIGNKRDLQHGIAMRFDAADKNDVSALAEVEKIFKEFYPDDDFKSHLVEEEIGWMHRDDTKSARLVYAATFITVFLSALGVFGLVMFTAEAKTKEIAIRKVLGATARSIAALLGKEFMTLLAIATAIAFPVAWYFMSDWLSTFAYRIDMTAGMYIITILAALLVGILTISYHTMKAATSNPARSLRSE